MMLPLAHFALSILQGTPSEPPPPPPRPNVLLILVDDLGWGESEPYGQPRIETPNLARMAQEGIRATRFYAGSAVCAPSRCSLLTGKHTGHAIVRANLHVPGPTPNDPGGLYPLPPGTLTLARVLRQVGYETACVGKWHLGGPYSSGHPMRQGFDVFYGYLEKGSPKSHYPAYLWRGFVKEYVPGNDDGLLPGQHFVADLLGDEAERLIRTRSDAPFFLFLNMRMPHLPLQAPEKDVRRYLGRWPEQPYLGGNGYFPNPSPRATYAAMVTHLDAVIGRLLDLLQEEQLLRDTLVIVTSDNGANAPVGGYDPEFFGSYGGFRGSKASPYEAGLRVPFFALWPGRLPAGAVIDHPMAMWDLFPTLARLAGAPVPAGLDGRDLWPILTNPSAAHPAEERVLYWEFPDRGGWQVVQKGRWKLIRRNLASSAPWLELSDLEADPGETRDVSLVRVGKMLELLVAMITQHVPNEAFPLPGVD